MTGADSPQGRNEVRLITTGAESRFRVTGFDVTDDGVVSGRMHTGAWCTVRGRPSAGSIGVLFDDVLGYSPYVWKPDGQAPVTTECMIEYFAPVPVDGSVFIGEAVSPRATNRSVYASGIVTTGDGTLIARGSERMHLIDREPEEFGGQVPRLLEPDDGDALSQLNAAFDDDCAVVLTGDAALTNPLGMLHGGIPIAATEMAAISALRSMTPGLATASVHVVLARPIPGDQRVVFTAEVLHAGRSLGVARVDGMVGEKRASTGIVTAVAT